VRLPGPAADIGARCASGTASSAATTSAADYPELLPTCMLIAVTEVNTRESIDRLVSALGEAAS
jgi:hypothetical protein